VASLELCIALVEMQHLSTIGDLIVALGGEPRYWRSNQGYWQGSEVDYGTTTSDKLRMDIRAEEAAISGYQALLDLIKDERVRSVLERIVRDEEVHLKLFREAYKRYA
jgi:bacterioferritin